MTMKSNRYTVIQIIGVAFYNESYTVPGNRA